MNPQNQLMIQRLKEEMKRMGINARELSGMAKVGKSFVYDILSGKSTNPTTHKITAVAKVLGVSVPYLTSGSSNDNETHATASNDLFPVPLISITNITNLKKEHAEVIEKEKYFFKKEWIEKKLKTKPHNLRAFFLNSESMSPTLITDDMLLIDITKKTPNPPGIFVLLDDSGFSIKRLEYIRKDNHLKVLVASDNPKYASYECDESELNIVGKISWFSRRT